MPIEPDPATGGRRRGRRPGPSRTREDVLAAARGRFAQDGYGGATIRAIAADAGVDPALVLQHFRSKEELFGAVMSIAPEALARIADAFDGPSETVGERVTRAHLDVWEGRPSDGAALEAMLRGSMVNGAAAAQLRGFLEARLTQEVHPELRGDPVAQARIGAASSMLVGLMVGRRVVGVPTLADLDPETLVILVAPAVQAVLGPLVRTSESGRRQAP